MINLENFISQFERLCAAFTKSITDKQKEQWFIEFEDCERGPFMEAMRRLQGGDKFPTWAMVWATYRPLLTPEERSGNPGCDECEFGLVFLVDYHLVRENSEQKVESMIVANCSLCSKDLVGGFFSIDRRKLTRCSDGEYWTQRALAHKRQAEAHIEAA